MMERFLLYEELKDQLYKFEKQYPHLCKIEVIGQSFEGRDLFTAIVTNYSSAAASHKPALYLEGNMHAGEVTASMVCLYVLDHVLTNSSEPQVASLLKHYTLYINPRVSPDGAEMYLTSPHTLRSSVRPYPQQKSDSGLVTQDLDGNGLILQMRLKHPEGNYRMSKIDSRLMVPRKADDSDTEWYNVYPEGLLQGVNGDRVSLAKSQWGLDFNRNYPANWAPEHVQKGAGPYPLSEPETRAVADFVMSHQNICVALSLHTTGEVLLRPLSTAGDTHMPEYDLNLYTSLVAQLAKELAGYDLIPVYNGLNKGTPSHGDFKDWAYEHLGILSLTTELWDAQVAAGIAPRSWIERQHIPEDEWEKRQVSLLKWNDEVHQGRFFVNWKPFRHPELGDVEIGGWKRKEALQNAPLEYRSELCLRNLCFILGLVSAMPRLEVCTTEIDEVESGLWRLALTVINAGGMSTKVTEKAEATGVDDVLAQLIIPEGALLVDGAAAHCIGQLEPQQRARVSWLVRADAPSVVRVKLSSSRAGAYEMKFQIDKQQMEEEACGIS